MARARTPSTDRPPETAPAAAGTPAVHRPLAGRHALVCGASAGIGRAAALALARSGASVTALARRAEVLDDLLPQLRAAGAPRALAQVGDLDDRPALARAVEQLLRDHGAIHVLVNNTGGPAPGPILEATEQQFLEAFGRHVLAAHLLVRTVLPGMRAAGFGRIVNILSSSVREPIPNLGVSNTIRAAMASWSKTTSRELPAGITINNILPGYVATERLMEIRGRFAERAGRSEAEIEAGWLAEIPEGRLADPAELGGVVAFLASPEAGYLRGQSIAVDGGRMRSI